MSQRIFMLLQLNEHTPARGNAVYALSGPLAVLRYGRFFPLLTGQVNTLHYTDYDLVYTGEMEDNDNLETLWSRFNIGSKPNGYLGVSMSISDVVVIIDDNSAQACYVDMGPYQSRWMSGFSLGH